MVKKNNPFKCYLKWSYGESKRPQKLMKVFKKGKRVQELDFTVNPTKKEISEIEINTNFIKWV